MIHHEFNRLFFPHDNKIEHFKGLDGLRGLAVLLVLLSHSSHENLFFHEVLNFQGIGKIGVYLFFVLSAYLLDRQIALAFMTNKSSIMYWKNYALRRFLRIYPLFVISLVLHGLLNLYGINTVIDNLSDIFLHMRLVKGESIFWSIPVEFKYYFISPIIMWFCHTYLKWNKSKLLLTFLLLIFISVAVVLKFNLSSVSTFRYFPIFLIGTLISIYELLPNNKIKKIKPKALSIFGFFAFALIILTVPYYFNILFGLKTNFHSPKFYLPYAIIWGIILLAAKYGSGLIKRILELKILRFIGSISFSIYLFHMLFLNIIKTIDVHPQIQFYMFLILTILFSSISFLLIERPLSKIRIYSNSISEKELREKKSINSVNK